MDDNPYRSPESVPEPRRRQLTKFQSRLVLIVIAVFILATVLAFLFVPQVQTSPPAQWF